MAKRVRVALERGTTVAISPLELLGERFRQNSRLRAQGLLRRHGHRLSPVERAAYETRFQSVGSLIFFRRRLLERLLRAAAYRRLPVPVAQIDTPDSITQGPYNDRAVLEATLQRTAASDPEWTREFLGLHARLKALKGLL